MRGCAAASPSAFPPRRNGRPTACRQITCRCSHRARSAFVREGERIVAHGGICIEELIVPFVQVAPGK